MSKFHTDRPLQAANPFAPNLQTSQDFLRSLVCGGTVFGASHEPMIASTLADDIFRQHLSDYEPLSGPPRTSKRSSRCASCTHAFANFARLRLPLDYEAAIHPRRTCSSQSPNRATSRPKEEEAPASRTPRLAHKQWKKFRFSSNIHSTNLPASRTSLLSEFSVGGDKNAKPPLLIMHFFAVNRGSKTSPIHSQGRRRSTALPYSQTTHYLCGCCTLQQGSLVVHPIWRPIGTQQFREGSIGGDSTGNDDSKAIL